MTKLESKFGRIDMTGQRFGRLTVVEHAGITSGPQRRTLWKCACECGNLVVVPRTALTRGKTNSCGCLKRETTSRVRTTHGHTQGNKCTALYRCWWAMVQRCSNPNVKSYAEYSTRGMDPRWLKFENFRDDMLAHAGPHPGKGYSIHRIDNDAGYWMFHPVTGEPQVKWADSSEQMRIQRKRVGCSSKYRGVNRNSGRGKPWLASFKPLNSRQKYLGLFDDEDVAALTRDIAVLKNKTGSPLNFPELLPKLQQYIDCEAALVELEKPLPYPVSA